MTIDEAIEYYINVATQRAVADEGMGENDKWNETKFMTKKESEQIIADNRQLAEWLTELKQWRIVFGVCPSLEMCISECRREGYNAQIAKYKRLLKAAVEDITKMQCNNNVYAPYSCEVCAKNGDCDYSDSFEWRYTNEALKLIRDSEEDV